MTNTYYDFVNGVDNKKTIGDRTLVDKECDPVLIFNFSCLCYTAAFALFLSEAASNKMDCSYLFVTGAALAIFYTAKPLGLKYHALGDLVIITAFGPVT